MSARVGRGISQMMTAQTAQMSMNALQTMEAVHRYSDESLGLGCWGRLMCHLLLSPLLKQYFKAELKLQNMFLNLK